MKSQRLMYLWIGLAAALLFIPFLGSIQLFDWDEINFAECAREMLVSKDYNTVQIGFYPFWEKPPLFIWMQAGSMHLFGVNEFAARFPNAICGIITLLTIYHIGRKRYDQRFGIFWVMAYAASLLPHLYFQSGIIDPWFNLFIFLSMYQFMLYTNETLSDLNEGWMRRRIVLSALFMSLAVLTKGPVALLIFALCFLYFRWRRKMPILSWKHFWIFAGISLTIPGIWFLSLALTGRANLIVEFIAYQIRLLTTEDATHGGSFLYHWIVLLFGCFPAAPLLIRSIRGPHPDTPFEQHIRRWMLLLFLVVLILFSFVQTKIVHYSSLCYFPLTYLAAYSAWHIWNERMVWKRLTNILLGVTAAPLVLAFLLLPLVDHWKKLLPKMGVTMDAFAAGSLGADGQWLGFEWLIGLFFGGAVAWAIFCFVRGRVRVGLVVLSLSSLVSFSTAFVLIIPHVSAYSQDAAVQFWKEKGKEDAYIQPVAYKSYAHYFYGNQQKNLFENPSFKAWLKENRKTYYNPKLPESGNLLNFQEQWLLTGTIDKPAYFICRNTYAEQLQNYFPYLKRLGEKNGFVFWKREASNAQAKR